MDELLHSSKVAADSNTARRSADAMANVSKKLKKFWEDKGRPFMHKLSNFGHEHPISPMLYLALSACIGIAAVVADVYDLSYVVNMNGTDLCVVNETAVFERAVESVETRATKILGYDYAVEADVVYSRALTERDDFATGSELETYLFNQIGEIMMGYDLKVNGLVIGSADDKAVLQDLLDSIAAPYLNENVIDYGFVENVVIAPNYITSDSNMDVEEMYATLTANTTGETTYTVVKGDTYSEIAYANDMTLDELMALNPEASIDRLMIGDVLNVKKIIPYLSVYTVENVTYHAPIECPVEYVKDSKMYEGNSKVITKGVEGEALINADIMYVNGYESQRTIITNETLSEPTTTVIAQGTAPRPKTASTGTYRWPCTGRITSKFGYRTIFGSRSFHGGIDIADGYGTNIVAADGGKVIYAGWKGNYGKLIIIKHDNGDLTYYGHCSSLLVSVGERVYKGEHIAEMGSTGRSTGNHCHFEIRKNGTRVNPLNYLP